MTVITGKSRGSHETAAYLRRPDAEIQIQAIGAAAEIDLQNFQGFDAVDVPAALLPTLIRMSPLLSAGHPDRYRCHHCSSSPPSVATSWSASRG